MQKQRSPAAHKLEQARTQIGTIKERDLVRLLSAAAP